MGYTSKPLEELDVMDDFLFSAIAADREVGEAFCRKLLSVLLGRKIGNMLRYLQHSTAENAMDTSTKELHDYVSRVKIIPEVRQGYMSLSERFFYERQEGIKEGARETMVENILDLLEDYGEIPEDLKERLNSIEDMALLKKYLKLAAKVDGIAEFQAVLAERVEEK